MLRGAGASFSAGLAGFQDAFTWWSRPEVLTVAAVQGRAVGAGEALQLGLAHAAVPRAGLNRAVDELVASLLVAEPDAVRETTELLSGALDRTPPQQLAAERAARARRLRGLAGEAAPPASR